MTLLKLTKDDDHSSTIYVNVNEIKFVEPYYHMYGEPEGSVVGVGQREMAVKESVDDIIARLKEAW